MSALEAERIPPALLNKVRAMSKEDRAKLIRLARPRVVEPYFKHIPHPVQQIFLNVSAEEAMYGGAAGGGKSDALLMSALQYVDVPGYSALILRRTWPDLNAPGAILDRARTWLASTPAKPKDGGRIWEFPSGARLQFGYLGRDADKFKFQCFSRDTELLTVDGWKKVAEVSTDDMVASVDPNSRVMTYEHVDRTFAYDFDGELVDVFQQNGVSFKVTPNHTVWSGTEKDRSLRPVRADQLPMTATIPQTFTWECAEPGGKSFNTRKDWGGHVFTAEQWLKFLGWYISEGNCGSYGGRWEVKITQHKETGWDELREDLSGVEGIRWTDRRYATLNNKALVEWLIEHTGTTAHHKRLPEEVWNLDAKWADVLLRALVAGDGSTFSEGWARFHTYSRQLADDVMRLAVHAGWRPTLDIREGGNYKEDSVTHIVHLSRRKRDTGLQTAKKQTDNTFWKRTPYKGKVYCVETYPHHTLIIRHRGRVSLSGNSAEYQFIGFDELTHFEQSTYEYMFSRIRRPALNCLGCNTALRVYRNNNGSQYYKHVSKIGKEKCKQVFPDPKVLAQYPPSKDGMSIFDVPLRMRSATNPGGIGHLWVKAHFIDPRTRKKDAVFVPARLIDNPSLDQESYEKNLMHLSSVDRERLLNGDWDVDEEGAMFQRHWFEVIDQPPTHSQETVRFWDLAATVNDDSDWTVGARVSVDREGRWIIEDIVRLQGRPAQVERAIMQTAMMDGINVPIRMEQEPGSAGVNNISNYQRNILRGFDFQGVRSTGSKEARAGALSSAAEVGNVLMVKGQWNVPFLDEITLFPNGAHDDQCDAVSGAVNEIAFASRSRLLV